MDEAQRIKINAIQTLIDALPKDSLLPGQHEQLQRAFDEYRNQLQSEENALGLVFYRFAKALPESKEREAILNAVASMPKSPESGRRKFLARIPVGVALAASVGAAYLLSKIVPGNLEPSEPAREVHDMVVKEIVQLATGYLKPPQGANMPLLYKEIETELQYLKALQGYNSTPRNEIALTEEMKAFAPLLRQAVDAGAGTLVQMFAIYYPDYLSKGCIGETKTRAVTL